MSVEEISHRWQVLLTSSPSLRSRGALTKARLNVRSWLGLLTALSIRVSPEGTLLTFACEIGILTVSKDSSAFIIQNR